MTRIREADRKRVRNTASRMALIVGLGVAGVVLIIQATRTAVLAYAG